MTVRVAINGFGRIGRCTLRHIAQSGRNDIEVVKINATGPLETTAHLLRYDSTHGPFNGDVRIDGQTLDVGHGPIQMFSTYSPYDLDWQGVDVVLECSGAMNSKKASDVHLTQGAKKVLISAPAEAADRTVVFGVNHTDLRASETIVSNGSCTTNCLAPLAKVLNDAIGIESGIMTTIHSYTGDQPALDRRHSDLYRARAAGMSMIPTSTGAAAAIGAVLPELKGRLSGSAIRVPTPNVSAVDLTFVAARDVTAQDVNDVMQAAAVGDMRGIVSFETEPKVSIDYNHNPHSCNFASDQTQVVGKRLVRVLAWYDNEWGFSCRMADNAVHMARVAA
jgi:glyceraldehyde 3-phosphate dehydrogenase (phosphorylating)